MIVDTSALLAFFNAAEPQHQRVIEALTAEPSEGLVVSPYVLAELDYLVATRVGVEAELAVLTELAAGAWELPSFPAKDLNAAVALLDKYADQRIGLANASLVVLAQRYETRTIATLERRHVTALRPLTGGSFTIVP